MFSESTVSSLLSLTIFSQRSRSLKSPQSSRSLTALSAATRDALYAVSAPEPSPSPSQRRHPHADAASQSPAARVCTPYRGVDLPPKPPVVRPPPTGFAPALRSKIPHVTSAELLRPSPSPVPECSSSA